MAVVPVPALMRVPGLGQRQKSTTLGATSPSTPRLQKVRETSAFALVLGMFVQVIITTLLMQLDFAKLKMGEPSPFPIFSGAGGLGGGC